MQKIQLKTIGILLAGALALSGVQGNGDHQGNA